MTIPNVMAIPIPERERVPSGRVIGLDVMRALSILGIMAVHYCSFEAPDTPGLGFVGYVSVEAFFTLSGFLIGGVLLKILEGDFGARELRHFYIRRWMRTLPNYYLFLAAYAAGLALMPTLFPDTQRSTLGFVSIARFVVFTQNFASRPLDFFGVSWTLAVEEWFYLTFPFLLWLGRRRLSGGQGVVLSVGCFAALALAVRAFTGGHSFDEDLRKVVLCRADATLYGVLAAWVQRERPQWWKRAKTMTWLCASFVAGCACVAEAQFSPTADSLMARLFLMPATSLGLAALLPALCELHFTHRNLKRVIVFLSLSSYSAYLLHSPVLALIRAIHPTRGGSLGNAFVFLIVTWTVSGLLYRYVELPCLRLRDAWVPR